MDFKIPNKFKVGGQDIEVKLVEQLPYNVGECCLSTGTLKIAQNNNSFESCTDSFKLNTFFHELTHLVLDTIGERDLSGNEKFVNAFSSILTEAIRTME